VPLPRVVAVREEERPELGSKVTSMPSYLSEKEALA
jgi:hypothetical protein